jgi:hypothetical protein
LRALSGSGPQVAFDRLECRPYLPRLEPHLRVGESEAGEPGCGVGLVTQAVAGLLGRGAVVAQAIGRVLAGHDEVSGNLRAAHA